MLKEEIIFLVVAYVFSFALGKLAAFIWSWLRILMMLGFPFLMWNTFNPQEININVFLVVIMPIIIFEIPPLLKMFGNSQVNIFSPFIYIYERITEKKYMKFKLEQMNLEREVYERVENITRMQNEEAERQRAYEREERERANRQYYKQEQEQAQQSKHSKAESSNNSENQKQENKNRSNTFSDDPYEVLGVTRNMSKQEIKKAYLKLMTEYAPDKVSHLSKEFQEIAHEKCIQFNLAWEKISKGH